MQSSISRACMQIACAFLFVLGPLSLTVLAQSCPAGLKTRTVAFNDSGEQVYGPVCIVVPINAVRYAGVLSFATTLTTPDLTKPFSGGGALAAPPATLNGIISDYESNLAAIESSVNADDMNLLALTNTITAIRSFVANSDTVFLSTGSGGVLGQKNNADFQTSLAQGDTAFKAKFEVLDDVIAHLRLLQDRALAISLAAAVPLTDPDKTRFANFQDALKAELTTLAPYASNGDKANSFAKAGQAFVLWQNRLNSITKDADFVLLRPVPCQALGIQTKTIAVSVRRIDLLPTVDNGTPTNADITNASIVVNCPSPLSVSGGLALSFLNTRSYGLVPATGGASVYGITGSTSTSPMPIAMIHARLFTIPKLHLPIQTGFGVAAHAQDDSAGGTGAEYLLGAGVILFRAIYITPGAHFGRIAALTTGNRLGDTAPSDAKGAPILTHYTTGFGLAITFTKP